MKKQIILIHGGTVFKSYKEYLKNLKAIKLDFQKIMQKDWKDHLGEKLGKSFEVVFPKMPNSKNARYIEWKIWFEKIIPFIENEVILIGHSLGGIFLAKYLSENNFPKDIKALFLVSPPFDEKNSNEKLVDFKFKKSPNNIQNKINKIYIYYSQDDKIVSPSDFEKYKATLPKAISREFENRGHFNQTKFPEIVRDIKSL